MTSYLSRVEASSRINHPRKYPLCFLLLSSALYLIPFWTIMDRSSFPVPPGVEICIADTFHKPKNAELHLKLHLSRLTIK